LQVFDIARYIKSKECSTFESVVLRKRIEREIDQAVNSTDRKLYKSYLYAISVVVLFLILLIKQIATGSLPKTSGEVELLFPKSSLALTTLEAERELFERSFTDVIMLERPSHVTQAQFSFVIEDIEDELLSVSGVQALVSPQSAAEDDPFNLKNGDAIRIILKISSVLSDEERNQTHREVAQVLTKFAEFSPRRTGSFVISQEVATVVAQETRKVIPWIATVLFLCLLFLFRSIRIGLLLLGITGLSLGTTVLLYAQSGYPLGPVSQLAPPFLLAISTSFVVLVASRLRGCSKDDRASVLAEVRRGIGLAAFTTCFSLVSLLFIDVCDVQRFALFATCGVILSALYAMTLPALFSEQLFIAPNHEKLSKKVSAIQKLSTPRVAWFITLLCVALSFGIPNLEVHTDPLKFLPAESKVFKDVHTIEKVFPGSHFLSLILTREDLGKNDIPNETLQKTGELIKSIPGITNVITPYDFINRLESRKSSDFLSGLTLRDSIIPLDFMTATRSHFRILIETAAEGKKLLALKHEIETKLSRKKLFTNTYSYEITSLELIMAQQTQQIVFGLIESLFTTIIIVFILLLITFRSIVVAFIGLIPNILPLFGVFGLLGFMSGELNFGSSLVATSALGIAVDNTFHFLLCWQNEKKKTHDNARAISNTLNQVTQPFITASFSLVAGFVTMIYAQSEPVQNFGILLAVTLFIGLFSDLVVLPVVLKRVQINSLLASQNTIKRQDSVL
jgi:uncharacterized protein